MSIQKIELGFQTSVFSFFPLPRTNVGKVFERKVHGISCTYLCAAGVPYSAIDRRWLEIVTTLAKRQVPEPRIEFGSVSATLRRYGMSRSSEYIQPARKALEKIGRLHVSTTRNAEVKGLIAHQGLDFSISHRHQILWARGRTDLVEPELFDSENFMELSPDFLKLIEHAAPHDQEAYMKIQSPLTLDLYLWVVGKLYGLEDDFLMRWAWIYAQFGNGGKLNLSQMKDLRRKVKESLLDIRQNYYPAANLEATDEGILMRPSDPLIEPNSKKAGYSLQ